MIPLGRRNVPNMIIDDDLTFRSQILNDVPLSKRLMLLQKMGVEWCQQFTFMVTMGITGTELGNSIRNFTRSITSENTMFCTLHEKR